MLFLFQINLAIRQEELVSISDRVSPSGEQDLLPKLAEASVNNVMFLVEQRKEAYMKFDIVRAWKDDAYRQNLSAEQLTQLPANPAGELELSDADLAFIYGGDDSQSSSFNRVKISSVCSIACSVDCNIRILNILGLL